MHQCLRQVRAKCRWCSRLTSSGGLASQARRMRLLRFAHKRASSRPASQERAVPCLDLAEVRTASSCGHLCTSHTWSGALESGTGLRGETCRPPFLQSAELQLRLPSNRPSDPSSDQRGQDGDLYHSLSNHAPPQCPTVVTPSDDIVRPGHVHPHVGGGSFTRMPGRSKRAEDPACA